MRHGVVPCKATALSVRSDARAIPRINDRLASTEFGGNEHGNGAGNADHWRASISWFLLDFGSRGALLDRARSRLAVAMALRDARFQQVIFDVARAYYSVQEA
ncbi:TolC family protein [Pandoraea apista]|uniref:TolC family protein n=1 Tax=Pandoraea apista TaxID=93218 RepID=UPI003CD0D866